MGILANENAISSGGYQISNSLRFQSASSQYLAKTGFTANRNIQTLSVWVKRGALGTRVPILGTYGASVTYETFEFTASDTLRWQLVSSGTTYVDIATTAVFRDPSAWYHVMFVNTGSVFNLYVNGVQVSWSGTGLNLGQVLFGEPTYSCRIGYNQQAATYFDGYMAELNFVSGYALTPSSFGTTDPTSGQWVAKKYAGTYGTNGFYLPFSNGTSTTTLGADSSGNGNNWTLTNFTRSAGVSDCWMYDVPSGNGSAGTQPNSNYCVMNPLDTAATVSASNLKVSGGTSHVSTRSTIQIPSSGLFYAEAIVTTTTSSSSAVGFGLMLPTTALTGATSALAGVWSLYAVGNRTINTNGTAQTFGTAITAGSVMQLAVDINNNRAWVGVNNTWYNSSAGTTGDPSTGANPTFTSLPSNLHIFISRYANTLDANFGQRSFAYTPPSGYKALCTANLPASTIVNGNQYMAATTYTGNGANPQNIVNTVNGVSFQPDFVWTKIRSTTGDNFLADAVRGAGNILISNSTSAEIIGTGGIQTFNSNGFGVNGNQNTNAATYVGWQWNAGGSTVTNTNGTISSQVRASTTAGFSVVTWTSQASGTATVGHGLGVAPKMIITKIRNTANAWLTYHASLGATNYVSLNTTNASASSATVWNSTSPTSSVMSFGTDWAASYSMVAYCFAEIAGFSKFGSYTGNGSADGPFVYCGFQPKYIMAKRTDAATYSWFVFDSARNTYNAMSSYLLPNASDAEASPSGYFDFLSNGFKLRSTYAGLNGSGATIIYACFASNPFQNSNAF